MPRAQEERHILIVNTIYKYLTELLSKSSNLVLTGDSPKVLRNSLLSSARPICSGLLGNTLIPSSPAPIQPAVPSDPTLGSGALNHTLQHPEPHTAHYSMSTLVEKTPTFHYKDFTAICSDFRPVLYAWTLNVVQDLQLMLMLRALTEMRWTRDRGR